VWLSAVLETKDIGGEQRISFIGVIQHIYAKIHQFFNI